MTLKIIELLSAVPALQSLAQQKTSGLAALHIRRLVMKLQPEVIAAASARDSLVTAENSALLQDGNRQIKPEFLAAFIQSPVLQEVINIDVQPLRPADIADALISPAELADLGPLVSDEDV